MYKIVCDMSKYIPINKSWRIIVWNKSIRVSMDYYEVHLNGTRTYHGSVEGESVRCTYDGSKAYAERKFRELLTLTAQEQDY